MMLTRLLKHEKIIIKLGNEQIEIVVPNKQSKAFFIGIEAPKEVEVSKVANEYYVQGRKSSCEDQDYKSE